MHFRRLWTLDILCPIANEERVFSSLRIPGHLEVQRRWALDLTTDEHSELLRLASQTYSPEPSSMPTLLDQALVSGIFTIVSSADHPRPIPAIRRCTEDSRARGK